MDSEPRYSVEFNLCRPTDAYGGGADEGYSSPGIDIHRTFERMRLDGRRFRHGPDDEDMTGRLNGLLRDAFKEKCWGSFRISMTAPGQASRVLRAFKMAELNPKTACVRHLLAAVKAEENRK